jgi:photosystem II stability/assembly factor-like uncharacterized protein
MVLLSACGGSGGGADDQGATSSTGAPPALTPPAPVAPPAVTPPAAPAIPAGLSILGPPRVGVGTAGQWRAGVPTGTTGLSYEWRFGDGATSTDIAPTYSYRQAGAYDIVLTVRNADGQRVEVRKGIQVGSFAMVEGLSCTGANASGWCWQQPQPDGNEARDGVFLDALRGWMVGDQGLIVHTVDGGKTWVRQAVSTVADLHKVAFRDARNGVAVALGGQVVATQNGGLTWSVVGVAQVHRPQRIWMQAGDVLVVSGTDASDRKSLAVSRDGGNNWVKIEQQYPMIYDAVDVDGLLWCVRCGLEVGEGRVGVTDYGAGTLAPRPAGWPRSAWVNSFDILDDGFGFALLTLRGLVDEKKLFKRSAPGGVWTGQPVQLPAGFSGYDFHIDRLTADGSGLMRMSSSSTPGETHFARTLDGGNTWTRIPMPSVGLKLVGTLSYADARTLWGQFVDTSGASRLLVTTDGGDSWRSFFPLIESLKDEPLRYYQLDIRRDPSGGLLVHATTHLGQWFRLAHGSSTWTEIPFGSGAEYSYTAGLWFDGAGRGTWLTGSGEAFDTADHGRHWSQQPLPMGLRPQSVQIAPNGQGWMVAGFALYKTMDGGRNWTAVHVPNLVAEHSKPSHLTAVLWTDGPRVRVTAQNYCTRFGFCGGTLLDSDDAGLTWSVRSRLGGYPFPGFAGPDVVVRSINGEVLRSVDRGMTWVRVSTQASDGEGFVFFQDANNGWVLGRGTAALRTRDGGLSWTPVTLPTPIAPPRGSTFYNHMAFADGQHGWIVGPGGAVLATRDGGTTWVRQASGTSRNFNRIWVESASRVWIAGDGVVLATVTGGEPDP